MSDLDFDLNAPAAPSLTLDAAPAAPTLTLDPEADAKVVEEAKKATPVTVASASGSRVRVGAAGAASGSFPLQLFDGKYGV